MDTPFDYKIIRDHDAGDYDVVVLGEYIGTASTFGEADDMVRNYRSEVYFKCLEQGCADAPAATD